MMDPNECLKILRTVVEAFNKSMDDCPHDVGLTPLVVYGEEMVDAFEDLDNWLSNGGLLPSDWDNNG